MCGIVGIFSLSSPKDLELGKLKAMCDSIAHRGPDDAGYFLVMPGNTIPLEMTEANFASLHPHLNTIENYKIESSPATIFLGHRRLAVIDKNPRAHQPMVDKASQGALTYNGEIYNFRELRNELKNLGHCFVTESDTEVVLKSYLEWGIDCVKKFNGMFAFAVWDATKNTLHLARDRYGIKPLYYSLCGDQFVFASEIKAILASTLYKPQLNEQALCEYFTFQNLFQYETQFKNIFILPPANIATITKEKGFSRQSYWDYNFTDRDESLDFKTATEETLRLMQKSIARHIVADVPVGSYLSGGMDSASITALAARLIPRITTFTAGFELSKVVGIEATFDERRDAEMIANEFKTEHYEQIINAGDVAHILPDLVWHLEDLRLGMCYANYYISRLASKFVKVCLSGAGGDEIYGGYPWRYYVVANAKDREDFFKSYYGFWQRLVREEDKDELFNKKVFHDPFSDFRRVFMFNPKLRYDTHEDHIANSLYFEIKTFLHGLLIVGDKLSMAHSLEERFPFLDNDLVDFAMKIPIRHTLKNIESIKRMNENETKKIWRYQADCEDGKNVLRAAMNSVLPTSVTKRRKQGFSSPDASWFRGENFDYVRDTLLKDNCKMDHLINKKFVRRIVNEHSQGTNHRLLIWSFLCFEEWCKAFGF